MAVSRFWIHFSIVALLVAAYLSPALAEESGSQEPSSVLILDAGNFSETVAKHSFMVFELCFWGSSVCKELAGEYDKAATILSKYDPPIVLAKVDANKEMNKELAAKYKDKGFRTLKILRDEGQSIQDYNGPLDADGMVEDLKRQFWSASAEIKSSEDGSTLIGDKEVLIVGLFPEYSGEEFKNFMSVAEKLRANYYFGHTSNAGFLPRGDLNIDQPFTRNSNELVVDTQDFNIDALENFIEGLPIVTTSNKDPNNHPRVIKFFNKNYAKAMLFLNFSIENFDSFKSKYQEVAERYKGKGISFLIGDLADSQRALRNFELKAEQTPLIVLQNSDMVKYLKVDLEPDQIATWFEEYEDGKLAPYIKSAPIPVVNDEPVKFVVADNLKDVVFNSGKNVLLEFHAPWSPFCTVLAPVLEKVAVYLENDANVTIAKFDVTANDIPSEFEVPGYPTVFLSSASNKIVEYLGDRTVEDIIDFILENMDTAKDTPVRSDSRKDEL